MATIITKFSSTPSSVPSNTDLVQGELAVNTADKRLYTEDNGNVIIELGTNPSSITTPSIILDGRDLATDRTKLDGIEPNATADQTDAEIKTAYENNADTNAFTDSEKTKLGTVESGADVTDATNVDAAGAVMNTDTSTAAMGFVIDEDDMASNSDTKVPTQQSVEARIQNRITAIGALMVTGTPVLNDYARFTSATEIEGRSYAEVRVDLGLEIGTDVQAELSGLAVTNVTASTSDKVLIQDVSDSNNLKTVLVSDILGNVITDPTLGTLTKTFVANEQATITLSSAPTGQPVVSVSKEVPQTGTTNNYWDVNSTEENYTRTNSAPATTLDFEGFRLDGIALDSTFDYRNSPSGSLPDNVDCIAFNADGTKYYAGKSGTIYERSLSTPYDISTQSGSTSATGFVGVEAIDFNPTGTKMFTLQYGSTIREYTLSTAFDITSATATGSTLSMSADNQMADMVLGDDGSSIFTIGGLNDQVYRYSLSTPYDLSTASATPSSTYQFGSAVEDTPNGLEFSNDGTVMLLLGSAADTIFEYGLSTAWDITTASQKAAFPVSPALPQNLAANADGSKFYVIGSQNVYTYTVPYVQAILGTGSFASADVGKTIEANGGVFVLAATDGRFVETTAPTSYNQVASGDWEMYSVLYNTTDGDLELSGVITGAFDISGASYSQNFSVGTQGNAPYQLAFNSDGTKMFNINGANDSVNEYTLSTGFDVSTATYSQNFSVSAQDTDPRGLAFNNDGTKMFVVGAAGDDVNEYALSTGFDVSTASYSQNFSVAGQDTSPGSIAFNTDGTKMFIVGTSGDDINEYTLSTGFDISTASFVDSFSVAAQESSPYGVAFNNDGTKMFVIGAVAEDVIEYALSTAFDVSTATYVQIFSVSAQDTSPIAVAFNNTGTKMFVVGLTGTDINEYVLGSDYYPSGYHAVYTTNSTDSTYWTDINSMTVDEDAGAGSVYYAVSTDDRTTWSVIDDTDGVRDIVRNNLGTWEYNSNSTYGSETWTAGTTNTELATLEEAMEGASYIVGFGLTDAAFVDSFDISAQETAPTGLSFNTDGTKMFLTGSGNDSVFEYTLSTGFDVSSATYSQSFSVLSEDASPQAVSFNSDGTKMFVLGAADDDVNEYTLSTGFDISTASYSQNFSVAGQDTSPIGMTFNADGTKMFISGAAGQDINEYTLTTGFDISTATYSQNFSVSSQEGTPAGVAFNSDGTQMFVVGNTDDEVNEYTLSTGFDISTASFTRNFSVSSQDTSPQDIAFSADGTKMFIIGFGAGGDVHEYTTGSTVYPNQMDKAQLEAVTDANHYTLGNDLDLAIVFNQTAGGNAPSSDGVSINYDANTLQKGAINGTDYEWDYPASDKVRITALAPANLKIRVV